MKYSILYIFIILTSSIFAQRSPELSEQSRFEAQINRDTLALERLLSKDLVYVHSNALMETKADFLHSISGGGIQYLEMRKLNGDPVRRWGRTALLSGVIAVRGNFRDSPFDVQLRYTSVYRKERGVWKLVSWQSTRIP
jgi:ketosteroid isomerase-like protein